MLGRLASTGPCPRPLGDAAEIQMATKALLKQAIMLSGDGAGPAPQGRLAGNGQGAERAESGSDREPAEEGSGFSLGQRKALEAWPHVM